MAGANSGGTNGSGGTLPPGPSTPKLVQTAQWARRPTDYMEECRARYGDTFTIQIVNEGTWVFQTKPDVIKEIFTGDPAVFHAGEANQILLPILGPKSVLLLDDSPHLRQRKLLLPPFHGERMTRYGRLIAEITDRSMDSWPVGEPFAVHEHTQAITLEVIMRAVFGMRDGRELDRLRPALKQMLDWVSGPKQLFLLALAGPRRMRSRRTGLPQVIEPVDAMIYEEIGRRRADSHLAEREDILSMLLQAQDENGQGMSDEELRDELMTLLIAGHETTATALAWSLERLVRHPVGLGRLEGEIEEGQSEYLDAVVYETLRLRPVLPIVLRKLTRATEVGGRLLPAGVSVVPCCYLVHRDPDVYPEPEAFRPERFLDTPPGTYTWFPFGGGVRRCVGASFALFEMKVVLSRIVARARLRAPRQESERIGRRAITFSPARGGEVIVDSIDSAPSISAAQAGETAAAAVSAA